jgi:hypothetical protein
MFHSRWKISLPERRKRAKRGREDFSRFPRFVGVFHPPFRSRSSQPMHGTRSTFLDRFDIRPILPWLHLGKFMAVPLLRFAISRIFRICYTYPPPVTICQCITSSTACRGDRREGGSNDATRIHQSGRRTLKGPVPLISRAAHCRHSPHFCPRPTSSFVRITVCSAMTMTQYFSDRRKPAPIVAI